VKIILTSILLFIIIRGLAEAEPFDLLLPVWSVVIVSMLTAYESRVVSTEFPASTAAAQLQLAP
jgi:hypothetical protein